MAGIRVRPQRRPRNYQSDGRQGVIIRRDRIAPGTYRYQVRVTHAASGSEITVRNVREGVNTFYENEAGKYTKGDRVFIQRESKGLWSITKKIPDPGDYPNPTSTIVVGRGVTSVDKDSTTTQYGEFSMVQSVSGIETKGPDIAQRMDEDSIIIENPESIMELKKKGAFEVRKNSPVDESVVINDEKGKKFYALGYPRSIIDALDPNDPDSFLIISDQSETYPTTAASADRHHHDIPPHVHVVKLSPINPMTQLQTDSNSVYFEPFNPDAPLPQLNPPDFTILYRGYIRILFFSESRNGVILDTEVRGFDGDNLIYERSVARSHITDEDEIKSILNGRGIDNLWVDIDPIISSNTQRTHLTTRGVFKELVAGSPVFGRINLSGNKVMLNEFTAAAFGIRYDNTVPEIEITNSYVGSTEATARRVDISWLPRLQGNIAPSADNISSIELYGYRIRSVHRTIPKAVSDWTYKLAVIVVPADGFTF